MTDASVLDPSSGLPRWRTILYDIHSSGLAESAATFFRVAIEPACHGIAGELDSLPRGPDEAAFDRWDELRDTQLELHRSFALALGGMWERHFRLHLSHSVVLLVPATSIEAVERAHWKDLLKYFEEARGFSLTRFPSYDQLDLLQRVTSAVRHGNGTATKSLFKTHPQLFSHEPVTDFLKYMTLGGEPQHSIHRLEVGLDQLAAFKDAIVDFWLMVDALRTSPNAY